jgi:transposase
VTRPVRILPIGPSAGQAPHDLRGAGVPLAIRLTGANRNDSQEALALVDAIPPLHGERGRPRQRPDCVLGDRGYDPAALRRGLRTRHIVPLLAMRRTEHGSGLVRWRWVVERTFSWLNQFRHLRVPYDKRTDIHEAFLSLGCAPICWQSLRKTWRTAEGCPFSDAHRQVAFSGGNAFACLLGASGVWSPDYQTLRRMRSNPIRTSAAPV